MTHVHRHRQALHRALDIVLASVGLALFLPLFLVAAVGIRLAGPGPSLYRARRVGFKGIEFDMLKFRTMRGGGSRGGPVITATDDARVFPFGHWLRAFKIDELPQLLNVLKGEMSIVGPRPEDPAIVRSSYTGGDRETLELRPGLSSPGSIYQYTHGDPMLVGDDPEFAYKQELMPIKLALDRVYVRRRSIFYELRIIWRTVAVIVQRMLGRRRFPEPPEMDAARTLLAAELDQRCRVAGHDNAENE